MNPQMRMGNMNLEKSKKNCIKQTNMRFKNGTLENPKEYLWNCIMRFGKTLTAYWMVRDNPEINKVLIITHRPTL